MNGEREREREREREKASGNAVLTKWLDNNDNDQYILYILWLINKYAFTNLSTRAGCDTGLIFKLSLTGLNSEFSFSYIYNIYVCVCVCVCWGVSPTDGLALMWHIPIKLSSAQSRSRHQERTLIFMIVLSWGGGLSQLSFIIFTNPSARAGYDTRSIFKRSLTGLNSEYSFS